MPDLPGYVTQNEKNLTDLKTEKAVLAEEGFPNRKTGLLVLKYWKGEINLPENSVLYVAPSTTGENKLPNMIARKIQRENPTAQIIEDFATAEHITKSAHKSALEKMADPVKWTLNRELEPTGKPAYIVDDVVTTGESVRVLREVLAERGIPIHGCISLQQSDRCAMYESDYKRMIPKLVETPGIGADLRVMMEGNSRRRAGVLESVLKRSTDKEKNDITNYIRSEAKRIREFDPLTRRILGEFGGSNHQLQQRRSPKTRDSEGR